MHMSVSKITQGILSCAPGNPINSVVLGMALHSACLFLLLFIFAIPCGLWDLSSPTRDQIQVHGSDSPSLNHWIAKEVPQPVFWGLANGYMQLDLFLNCVLNSIILRNHSRCSCGLALGCFAFFSNTRNATVIVHVHHLEHRRGSFSQTWEFLWFGSFHLEWQGGAAGVKYLYFKKSFWLYHTTCGILVSRSGIEPVPLLGNSES